MYDNLSSIDITQRKLYDLLCPRVGKKKAKAMAYSKRRVSRWKINTLVEYLGHSLRLKDIRLLYLFCCPLSDRQMVLLHDNKQKYRVTKGVDV